MCPEVQGSHERGFEVGSQILQIMYDFVIWPFEISDGGISAVIQNYELPFEPSNLWELVCSCFSFFVALGFWKIYFFGPKICQRFWICEGETVNCSFQQFGQYFAHWVAQLISLTAVDPLEDPIGLGMARNYF